MIKSSTWLKKLAPVLSAIAIFLVIDMIYFAPQFEGKQIKMHDVTQYSGMGRDIELHIEEYGENPNWAGRLFSGMPAYLIRAKQPQKIINHIRNYIEFIGYPASLIFVAMLSFFLMLLMWGINPWLSIPCAIGYGLSSYMVIIIGAGHVTKMAALAYAPLLIGTVYYAYRKNRWLGAAMTAFIASLEIATGHPQITYYFVMILAAFAVNEAVIAYKNHTLDSFFKTSATLILAAMLAVGTNLVSLYYTSIASKDTVRGGSELKISSGEKQNKGLDLDYATAWSYGLSESFNMLIPNLMGGESSCGFSSNGEVANSLNKYSARSLATNLPGYWGGQPMTSGPVYIGAVMVFLAIFGFFLLTGLHKWWVLIISGIALMLAWGNNMMWFTELFFKILPGYNKFRTVSMILVILQWSLPFMAALTLNKLTCKDLDKQKALSAFKKALGLTGGICLVFLLFGSSLFNFSGASDSMMGIPEDVIAAMRSERASMLKSDALRSLFFVIASALAIYLYISKTIKISILTIAISILTLVDLVGVNLRYLPQNKFVSQSQITIQPTSADTQIMQDKELGYRVANFTLSTFNDATTSYFHRSIGGYHGAKLSRYQDLIDNHLSKMNMEVYNMLNTKYFITANEQQKPEPRLNPDANGAAWFVDELVVANGAREEIDALNKIKTKTTAVVEKSFKNQVAAAKMNADSTRKITLTDYKPHHLTYKYSAEQPQVAVFSEVYYPQGWDAYIDGEKADYFRVNYLLRAMALEGGEHTIEFKFDAPNYKTVAFITTFSTIATLIILLIAVIIYYRKNYGISKQ